MSIEVNVEKSIEPNEKCFPKEEDIAPMILGSAKIGGKGIYEAIPKIMAEVKPVAKSQVNQQQRYKFRGIDDVYLALQQVMAKHGVFTTSDIVRVDSQEKKTAKGGLLFYKTLHIRWTFRHSDGSYIQTETITEAMDSGDKAFNKAMSVGHKYALLQVFCIPTDEPKDPENDSHQVSGKSNDVASQVVAAFTPFKVTRFMLEAMFGMKIEEWQNEQITEARDLLGKMKAGSVTSDSIAEYLKGKNNG